MDTSIWIVVGAAMITAIMTGAGALPFLPVGLGLAAGAMVWMVFSELFPDALENVGSGSAATAATLALVGMMALQLLVLSH